MKMKAMIILFLLTGIVFSTQRIKVSCIGNSITEQPNGYVGKLGTLLGAAYKVENDGVNATTLLKDGDIPYWTNGKLKQVFMLQPNIVTIKLGTNDTKPQNWDSHHGDFKRDYLAMIDTLNKLASKPKIWIVLPVPIFSNTYGIRDSALKKIIVILKEIGQERNLPIIDANTPLLNKPQCFSDGVHPKPAGADTIANVIYRALTTTTVAGRRKLTSSKNGFIDIAARHGSLSITVPSEGLYTAQLIDLRGSIIHTQSLPTPGRHTIKPFNAFHGVCMVRLKSERETTLYREISIP